MLQLPCTPDIARRAVDIERLDLRLLTDDVGDDRPGDGGAAQIPSVHAFSPAGKLLQLWTVPKGVDGQEKPGGLNWVHGIAVDSAGIHAGDITGKRAQMFVRNLPSLR